MDEYCPKCGKLIAGKNVGINLDTNIKRTLGKAINRTVQFGQDYGIMPGGKLTAFGVKMLACGAIEIVGNSWYTKYTCECGHTWRRFGGKIKE